jgi:hypothetical protein
MAMTDHVKRGCTVTQLEITVAFNASPTHAAIDRNQQVCSSSSSRGWKDEAESEAQARTVRVPYD